MSNLWITVEASPGSDIDETCKQAVKLASKLGATVWFTFNGVKCGARPQDDPESLADAWMLEMNSKNTHKVAVGRKAKR